MFFTGAELPLQEQITAQQREQFSSAQAERVQTALHFIIISRMLPSFMTETPRIFRGSALWSIPTRQKPALGVHVATIRISILKETEKASTSPKTGVHASVPAEILTSSGYGIHRAQTQEPAIHTEKPILGFRSVQQPELQTSCASPERWVTMNTSELSNRVTAHSSATAQIITQGR